LEDLIYLNALRLVPGIGSATLGRLLHKLSPRQVWIVGSEELTPYMNKRVLEALAYTRQRINPEAEWEKLVKQGIKVCTVGHKNYPESLAEIYDPPLLLYYRGNLSESELSLAVVGSRRASPYGRTVGALIVKDLAKAGFTVISGGARGIDTVAHQAALDAGGRTIAVLGNGLDIIYPRENMHLFSRIQEQGAVVSEYPLGTEPLGGHFPARNRIISGMSLGTLVVEGAEKSGSLITADCALEQGRDVFAVPGPVTGPGSRGPHKLIKQGAKLVESAADILLEYGYLVPDYYQVSLADLTLPKESAELLELLSLEPIHIDVICKQLSRSPEKLAGLLVNLELSGQIRQLSGGHYIKTFV
jgi:DNA processing protein